jgi:uncharacterized protein (TIGR03083 family)
MIGTSYDEIVGLIEGERNALLDLLNGLAAGHWESRTSCPGWSVKDIAAHILGDDMGILARERDRYTPEPAAGSPAPAASWEALVRRINAANEVWVDAWRRVSPALIREPLALSGPRLGDYYRTLDADTLGDPVSWAGDDPAPNWLRVAREYTERWVHQQQIRDAVGVPGVQEAQWVRPLLDTFAHSLPIALRTFDRPEGTTVLLVATGEGGDRWAVVRREGRWSLGEPPAGQVTATTTLDVETLWHVYTKAIDRTTVRKRAEVFGDEDLGRAVLSAVAIIA